MRLTLFQRLLEPELALLLDTSLSGVCVCVSVGEYVEVCVGVCVEGCVGACVCVGEW